MSDKRGNEKALFEHFVKAAPDFAGEPLAEWSQPRDESDFPDITGKTLSSKRVGIEIAEWLNQEEIQEAKKKERVEQALLDTIGDQGENPTKNIDHVWLRPKDNARVAPADGAAFREQLSACIMECDRRWPNERFWKVGHHVQGDELKVFPVLAKYLDAIQLAPSSGFQRRVNWITFPNLARFFGRETMFKPLRDIVTDKVKHYGGKSGFDVLVLLVIYNKAAMYNSPAETPFHSYEDAVKELRALLATLPSPFDRVFLYIALEPDGKVFRVI